METDKPLISILMAVYEPRMDWLREQLDSLNRQTYPNLRLYIRDDCSRTVPYEVIAAMVSERITAIPFTIVRNENNLGSNGTFELLTNEAEGSFFAFCDQDDIWLEDRVESCYERLYKLNAGLCCSDVMPIDENGEIIADSITAIRPRHIFKEGDGLAKEFIYRNFVIGCTMLIKSDIAKKAVPFPKSLVHDHYLAFFTAIDNSIAVVNRPLVRYRQHKNNQTGVLVNINSKRDYIEKHLMPFAERLEVCEKMLDYEDTKEAKSWLDARLKNARHEAGCIRELWKLRNINKSTTLFELIALRLPEPLFRLAVRFVQSGRI